MDTTVVGGELVLVEYRKEQLFWAFQLFLSAVVWAHFLKLKRVVE